MKTGIRKKKTFLREKHYGPSDASHVPYRFRLPEKNRGLVLCSWVFRNL